MKIEVKTAFTILKVLFTHVVLTGEYFDYFHFNRVDLTKINVGGRLLTSCSLMVRATRPWVLLKDHPILQEDDRTLTSFQTLCKHLFYYRRHVYSSRH